MRAAVLTLAGIAAVAAAAVPAASFAGGPNVGFSISIGGPPVYYPPPPVVFYPPPPVAFFPPPVIAFPPVVVFPRPYYGPPSVAYRAGGHGGFYGPQKFRGQGRYGYRGHGGRGWH